MIPYLIGAAIVSGLYYLYTKANINPGIAPTGAPVISPRTPVPADLVMAGGVMIPDDDYMFTGPPDDVDTWPIVTLGNDKYRVAPSVIAPVGIGQAKQIAESRGFQLPTPALVDAIWRAADLKIAPIIEVTDFTPKTMDVPEMFIKHKQKILSAIDGRPFELLAGTHKDVVMADIAQPGLKAGAVGLYGWHANDTMVKKWPDGKLRTIQGGVEVHAPVSTGDGYVIQQPFGGHGLEWRDFSQSVRLVKKVV